MENNTKVRTLDSVKSFEELSQFIEDYKHDDSLDIFEKEELEESIVEKGTMLLNDMLPPKN